MEGWQSCKGSPEEARLRLGVEGWAFVRMGSKEGTFQTPRVRGKQVHHVSGASEAARAPALAGELWTENGCVVLNTH